MTQDEIIVMAKQVGLAHWHKDLKKWKLEQGTEAFARLVAAKEHEWLIGYIRIHQPSCEQMANAIRARGEA